MSARRYELSRAPRAQIPSPPLGTAGDLDRNALDDQLLVIGAPQVRRSEPLPAGSLRAGLRRHSAPRVRIKLSGL